MRRARRALLLMTAIANAPIGCGAAAMRAPAEHHARPVSAARATASASSAPPRPTPLEALASVAAASSPGTRELLRRDVTSADHASVALDAQDKDSCLRVFVSASFTAHVALVSSGRELASGEQHETAPDAPLVLAARGPVCVRRGEAPELRVDGTGTAHVVVRVSP